MYKYDAKVDILDIELRDGISAQQIEVEAGTIIDLDNQGRLLDVEIIAPYDGWSIDAIKERVKLTEDEQSYLKMVLEVFLRKNVDMLSTMSIGMISVKK